MKLKRTLLLSFGLVALACSGQKLDGGSEGSILVRQALAPGKDAQTACDFQPVATWPSLSDGTLDIGVRGDYSARLLVEAKDGAAMRIEKAHVRLLDGDSDGPVITEGDVDANGFVDAGGLAVVTVRAIGFDTSASLEASLPTRTTVRRVVAEISVAASPGTSDNAVTAPVFRLPVNVCNGCLVSFSDANDPAVLPQPNCGMPLGQSLRMPCVAGQDEPVPCQACTGRAACDPAHP